ncbi:MAG: helix-turn-helix domain-containing protein [Patescibacteria group bacterium]
MTKQSVIPQKALGERIQKLRQEHGYSQEQLATQIGVSRQAIGQIEKGERSIGALEIVALSKALGVSVDWIVQTEKMNQKEQVTQMERDLNFSFDKEKFRQTLLYILCVCGGKANIGETVLYKLLYFIDFNAFEILGKPVTGMQYVKMQFGPVPRQGQYRDAVKEMVENNELKIFLQEYYGMSQRRYVALADPDIKVFSIEEKVLIDREIRVLSDFTATKIAEYVHGDAPWVLAEDGEPIRYSDVVGRTSPYAQIDHWARWEAAGVADSENYLPPLSKEERDYYEGLRPKT